MLLNAAALSWWLSAVSCVFLIQQTLGQKCHPVDQCTCKTDDGKYVSLWEIDKSFTVEDRMSRGFKYTFRPCTAFNSPGASSECTGVLACQSTGDGSHKFAIANYANSIMTSYDASKNLLFKYTGSIDSVTSTLRTTEITLTCDKSATIPSLDTFLESPSFHYVSSVHTTTLTTKCACPGECQYKPHTPPPRPPPATVKKGLSIGSVLCIILLVLLIVYLVGGILISKFVFHKEGSEIVPNGTFWKGFPFLVKDGILFTYHKISGKQGEYEKI
eukprot:gene3086-3551_t